MTITFRPIFAFMLLLIVAAPIPAQQGTGAITGRASDPSGAVIPGVTVTLNSPAVMGAREAVTDERGSYRFDLLPLGTYALKFELPGFGTFIREGIQITGGFTATINASLEIATQSETVTVTGQSPVVDLQSATLAVNLSPEMLTNLPTARDMVGVMGMAPGVMMQKFDVGGSMAGTSLGFRTYGTDGQSYALIDGVITTNNIYGDFGSVQETQVIAASKGAEIKVAGAYTNNIVKSGSNDFHGSMHTYWESPRFQGSNLNDRLRAFGLTATNRVARYYDINGDIGGPIKKDKLWWYFSARMNHAGVFSPGFKKGECTILKGCQDKPIGTFVQENPSTEDEVFFTDMPTYTTKLNYQLNLTNQISYTGSYSNKHQPFRGGFGPLAGFFNADSVARQVYPNYVNKVQWTSAINNGITMDTWYATNRVHWPFTPRVNEYSRRDLDTQMVRGGFSGHTGTGFTTTFANLSNEVRWQYNLHFTVLTDKFITGSHNIKMGYARDVDVRRQTDAGTVGQIILYYNGGFKTPAFIETLDLPFGVENGSKTWALFINDTWRLTPKLTLNLGYRFDQSTPFYLDQKKDGIGPYQPRQVVPARDVVSLRGSVPRLSVIYDLLGDGKTALKASYGRYVNDPGESLASNVNPMRQTKNRYVWDATGPLPDCYLTKCEFDTTGRSPVSVSGGVNRDVGTDLKFPYTDEYTLGVDRELMPDLSLRLFVVRKFQQNGLTSFNDAIPYAGYSIPVNDVDPGRDGRLGTADDRNIELFGLEAPYVGKRRDIVRNDPALDYANTSVDATLVKRFSKSWQLVAGWDYLHRKVWGGESGIASDTSGIPQNPNNRRYNNGENYNAWHIKAMATYEAPYGIKLSGMYRAAKGEAYGRRWNTRRLSQGVQTLYVDPIGTFFMDTVRLLDLRFEKRFTLDERWGNVSAMFDLFNILNSAAVTGVNDLTGTTFQTPTQTLEPRVAKLGVKYTF